MRAFAERGEPTAAQLLRLRGSRKLLETFFGEENSVAQKKDKGMLSLVHHVDDSIHHELALCHTTTGRTASLNPNMQNIPRSDATRALFVSPFWTPDRVGAGGGLQTA